MTVTIKGRPEHASKEFLRGWIHATLCVLAFHNRPLRRPITIEMVELPIDDGTCQSRKTKHVVFWDEPDLGLSGSWAAGVGQAICKFAKPMPRNTVAAMIVTHSKPLVRELLPAKPVYLHMGVDPSEAPPTLKDWLEHHPEPRDIEELSKVSRKRFLLIQHILNQYKP